MRAHRWAGTAFHDPESLHHRMVEQYSHHYGLIVSIFKGVSLFAAAASLLSILAVGGAVGARWNAFAYWAASFITIAATYDAFMVGSLINTARPNVIDVILPFFIGLGEFLLFAAVTLSSDDSLSDAASSAARLEQIAWWPLVLVGLNVAASISMANFRSQLTTMIDSAPDQVKSVSTWYRANLRKNQMSTAAVTCFLLLAFVLLRWGFPEIGFMRDLPEPQRLRHWQGLLGVFVLLGMAGVLREQERARRHFTDVFLASSAASAATAAQGTPTAAGAPDGNGDTQRPLHEVDALRASDRRHRELLARLRELVSDEHGAGGP